MLAAVGSRRRMRADRGPYQAPCRHYPNCIGCPFIDLPYPEQLVRKRALVGDALGKFAALKDMQIPEVVPSPRRLGYRARVKLVVRKSGGAIATGLYVPQTHRVMDISSCPVHPRRVNQVLDYLKSRALELGIVPYDERDDSGDLRYVDFRYSFARQEVSVTLVSRHAVLPEGEKLARALQRKFSFVTGVILNINENRGNVIWGAVNRMLSGRESLLEQIGGLKLVYPAGVFSQSNPNTAQKLYDHVRELANLTGKESVLDLYCGVGPISLNLAAGARQVWGIDDNETAIVTAKQNARRNGVGNCRFFTGDAAAMIQELGGATEFSRSDRRQSATQRSAGRRSSGAAGTAPRQSSSMSPANRAVWRAIWKNSCREIIAYNRCSLSICFRRPRR